MGVTCFDERAGQAARQHHEARRRAREATTASCGQSTRSSTRGTGYFFEMNPSGLMADSLMSVRRADQPRSGTASGTRASVRSEIGWTIEIEIPFRTLNFNPERRRVGRQLPAHGAAQERGELLDGMGTQSGTAGFDTPVCCSASTACRRATASSIRPYGVTSALASPGRGRTADETGCQRRHRRVLHSVTPALRANLTVNTDFAQTEVDQRQVNLTRSRCSSRRSAGSSRGRVVLRLRELRIAEFRQQPQRGRRAVLHATRRTRRQRRSAEDRPRRQAHRAGRQAGRRPHADPDRARGWHAGRRLHRPAREAQHSAAVACRRACTRRDARAHESAIPLASPLGTFDALNTLGADFRLGTTRLRGNQNLFVTGYYLTTTNPSRRERTGPGARTSNAPNDRYVGRFNYREVQQNYDPAVGFTLRNGYRRYAPQARFQPQPRRVQGRTRFGVQQYQFGVSGDLQYLTTRQRSVAAAMGRHGVSGELSDRRIRSRCTSSRRHERLDRNFNISRDITLPIGAGATTRATGSRRARQTGGCSRSKPSSRRAASTRATAISSASTSAFVRGAASCSFSTASGIGSSCRRAASRRASIARFSRRSSTRGYRSRTTSSTTRSARILGWQSRFRWIMTPGNDYLHRLQPQLAGRSGARPVRDAGPAGGVEDSLYLQILKGSGIRIRIRDQGSGIKNPGVMTVAVRGARGANDL